MKGLDERRRESGKHVLAELLADSSGLYIDAREAVGSADGFRVDRVIYRPSQISEDTAVAFMVLACPCGNQYDADLALVFRNRTLGEVTRVDPDDLPGINVSRRRTTVQD